MLVRQLCMDRDNLLSGSLMYKQTSSPVGATLHMNLFATENCTSPSVPCADLCPSAMSTQISVRMQKLDGGGTILALMVIRDIPKEIRRPSPAGIARGIRVGDCFRMDCGVMLRAVLGAILGFSPDKGVLTDVDLVVTCFGTG